MVILGMRDRVLSSDFIWLCTQCETCEERCPQDVLIPEVMDVIKNLAVKEGYIEESYMDHAKKAYLGMIEHLIRVREDGGVVLTPVCAVAGLGGDPYRDGSYEYYVNERQRDNDPKGFGPFILASILYENL